MPLVLLLLAVFGLAFLIKESDGPCGIMACIRNLLMRNKYIGTLVYKLLDCYFCVGCHCGYIVYLLSTPIVKWSVNDFVIWMLAGGAFSFIMNLIIERLVH